MRRKLFFVTILFIVLLFVLDGFGVCVGKSDLEYAVERQDTYTAKVLSVEKKEERYDLQVSVLNPKSGRWSGKHMLITYYGEIEQPWALWKSIIEFDAKPEKPIQRRNPGCFDYGRYLKSKGIEAVASVSSFRRIRDAYKPWDKAERMIIKKKLQFVEGLDEGSKGLIAGVLFGDTSFLEEDIYEGFKDNNTAHILAVSGLHMGILYKAVEYITRRNSQKIKLAAITATLLICGTVAMWSPSVTRATGMIGLSIYCRYADERYDFLTALSVIALGMVLKNPYVIFNTGFQMSFLAAASIAFLLPHIPDKVPDFLAVIVAVNLGLLPYQWFQFNSVSFSSILANIPVVYMISILMPLAALSFVMFCIGINLLPVSIITEAVTFLLIRVNELSSLGGKGAVDLISPPLWLVLIFYMCIFFAASETFLIMRMRRKNKEIILILTCFVCLSAGLAFLNIEPVGDDEIIFVDVGQGDCCHLSKYGIIIDGGGSINYNIGKNTLKPYLLKNGVSHIDTAIATHLHTDHYKGLKELQEEGMTSHIYSGLTAGRVFNISDDVTIETLWPLEIADDQDENSNCSVFMIYYKDIKILVTGDLDSDGESAMMELYKGKNKFKADILKIGHHGSKSSTSDEFLKAVDPQYCVIQVGKNNYGHPDAKIIEKCCQKDIIVLRNDIHGAIGFSVSGREIEYHTMIATKGQI